MNMGIKKLLNSNSNVFWTVGIVGSIAAGLFAMWCVWQVMLFIGR